MRARSAWLSHPKFKATWVAIAAGSLAGLAVLGACSQDSAKIVGTRPVPESPRLGTIVGGNAHVVKVCSDLSSTGGPVTVNVSFQGGKLELNAVDADNINTYQYNFGPYTTPDVITSTVTISPNECKTVFQRNNTCAAGADCSDPLQHLGNRMWTNESNTSNPPPGGSGTPPQGAVSIPWPNIPQVFNGIVNPRAGVFITAVIPNGYTMDNLVCTNDDVLLPQSCVNGGYSSANVFHGSVFTYTFTSHETPCPAGTFTWSIANSAVVPGYPDGAVGDILVRYDQFPAPNDNSYGVNAVGWPNGHTFGNLTGSDKAGIQIKLNGVVKLSFNMDYLTSTTVTAATPSGYKSFGVLGGDGGMVTGTATGISVTTSLANNLNLTGYCVINGGAADCDNGGTNLLVNSPPTLGPDTYDLPGGSPYTNWDFHDTYYARINPGTQPQLAANSFPSDKAAAEGAGWLVEPNLTVLHNSPAKPCPLGPFPCDSISVGNKTAEKKEVRVSVNNNSQGQDAFVTGVHITWPTVPNGALLQIKVGGGVIWTGSNATGTANLVLADLVTDANKRKIGNNSAVVVKFIFANNAAAPTSGYTASLDFGDNCNKQIIP